MNPLVSFRRVAGFSVPAGAIALFLGACGARQMQAKAPPAPPAREVGATNVQPTAPSPIPTTSRVAISEEILRACNIPDADAYFEFDSSRLTSFDHDGLDQLAVCFTRGPMAGRSLRLVGHADPRGASEYNMTLGQSRADSVAAYLTGHGLRSAQATTTSRGALDATGHDETGWAHDRRVDILLGN